MNYKSVIVYSSLAAITAVGGCSSSYQIGKFSISQKTIDRLSDDTNKIGNLIDVNRDQIITEEEIRGAVGLLEKVLEASSLVQAANE